MKRNSSSTKNKICSLFSVCDLIILVFGLLLILSGIGLFITGRILIEQLIHEVNINDILNFNIFVLLF